MRILGIIILAVILLKPIDTQSEEIAKLANSKLEISYWKTSQKLSKWSFNLRKYSTYAGLKANGFCSRKNSTQKCTWSQNGKNFNIKLHKSGGALGAIERNFNGYISGNYVKGSIFTKKGVKEFEGRIFPSSYLTLNENKIEDDKISKDKLNKEKQKIAEEKRKIEEEKRKIAEAKKKQQEEEKQRKEANSKLYIIGSGTGFFVNTKGHVVSNEHVVGGCKEVATKIEGEIIKFKIITTDITNDIGLIKTDFKNTNYLNINSSGAEIGEDIVAFGYPLSEKLSSSVKLTRGIVSSLSGPGNNYSLIQIDAAIQPGNSGGPVLNYNSQVVGIASAGLRKVKMLVEEEYIPENVNFAVSAATLSNFLKANDVNIGSEENKVASTKQLAQIGIPATVQLYCLNTIAAHKQNKENERYGDVMLEKVIDLR